MTGVLCLLNSVALSLATVDGVYPQLHPKSDDRFFSDDYPQDTMPAFAGHKFGHPYPSLQDSDEYDRDYVQDENSDKGEWTTQMQYDVLKNRLAKERAELQAAGAKLEKEKAEYEQLVGTEKAAEEAAEQAERQAAIAAGEAEEAGKYQKAGASPGQKTVDGASADVESEVAELKECEGELAAAQKRLKELLAQLDEAQQAAAEAAAHADAMEDAAESAEKAENAAEAELAAAKKQYEETKALLNKALGELAQYQDKLDKAAKRLHEIRFKQAGKKGGVYTVEEDGPFASLHAEAKSSAATLGLSALALSAALLLA